LTERAGKLLLKLKKTVIDNHVKSRTHGIKKEKAIVTDSGGGYQALLNVTLHEERKQEQVAGLVSRLSTETEEYRCKIAYVYILDFENLSLRTNFLACEDEGDFCVALRGTMKKILTILRSSSTGICFDKGCGETTNFSLLFSRGRQFLVCHNIR
jgi:hypothetical protein